MSSPQVSFLFSLSLPNCSAQKAEWEVVRSAATTRPRKKVSEAMRRKELERGARVQMRPRSNGSPPSNWILCFGTVLLEARHGEARGCITCALRGQAMGLSCAGDILRQRSIVSHRSLYSLYRTLELHGKAVESSRSFARRQAASSAKHTRQRWRVSLVAHFRCE